MKNNYPTYWLFVIILLLILAGNVFGQKQSDFNQDGNVDLFDLNVLTSEWGSDPNNFFGPILSYPELLTERAKLLTERNDLLVKIEQYERERWDLNMLKNFIDQLFRAQQEKTIAEVRAMMLQVGNELLETQYKVGINWFADDMKVTVIFDPNGVR